MKCFRSLSVCMERNVLIVNIHTFFFSRSSNFYREDEDKALLNFIVQKKRYDRAGGVHLWMFMEQKQVVPGKGVTSRGRSQHRLIKVMFIQ